MSPMSRRQFLEAAAATTATMSMVEVALADPRDSFTFAHISDAHIQQIKGSRFVRNWDRGLIRAVAETNLLVPKPDFVVFGGDLAQLGALLSGVPSQVFSALPYLVTIIVLAGVVGRSLPPAAVGKPYQRESVS